MLFSKSSEGDDFGDLAAVLSVAGASAVGAFSGLLGPLQPTRPRQISRPPQTKVRSVENFRERIMLDFIKEKWTASG